MDGSARLNIVLSVTTMLCFVTPPVDASSGQPRPLMDSAFPLLADVVQSRQVEELSLSAGDFEKHAVQGINSALVEFVAEMEDTRNMVLDILQWQPDGGWVGELEAARSIQLGALKDWLAMEPEEQLEISLESFHQQAEQSMTNRRSILETSAYPASDDEAADGDASSLVSGDQMNDAINIAVANALDRASELFSYFEGQDLSPILVHGVQEVLAFERSLFGDDDTVQLDLIEAF